MVDVGFSTLKHYYASKKPLFKKIATDCVEIQLSDHDINQKLLEIEREEKRRLQLIQDRPNLKQVVELTQKDGEGN